MCPRQVYIWSLLTFHQLWWCISGIHAEDLNLEREQSRLQRETLAQKQQKPKQHPKTMAFLDNSTNGTKIHKLHTRSQLLHIPVAYTEFRKEASADKTHH